MTRRRDEDDELHVSSKDAILSIVINVVLSVLLQRVVETPVYIGSMVVMVLLSCVYVSLMSRYRHEREIESIKRLFD